MLRPSTAGKCDWKAPAQASQPTTFGSPVHISQTPNPTAAESNWSHRSRPYPLSLPPSVCTNLQAVELKASVHSGGGKELSIVSKRHAGHQARVVWKKRGKTDMIKDGKERHEGDYCKMRHAIWQFFLTMCTYVWVVLSLVSKQGQMKVECGYKMLEAMNVSHHWSLGPPTTACRCTPWCQIHPQPSTYRSDQTPET